MNIQNTAKIDSGEGIVMAVYGSAKVGKTTFAASTSKYGKTLVIDFETGTKYLGERGIEVDTVWMSDWFTDQEVKDLKSIVDGYETIVVDPVGEAMDFLITGDQIRGAKMRQQDGSLTMAGWGEAKKRMRGFIKWLRSTGKNIILVFHDDRQFINEQWYHSLMIATKLKEVIPGMVEIISFLGVVKNPESGEMKRCLYTPANDSNFDSGDRTGRVPEKVFISEQNGWGDFLFSLAPKKAVSVPEKPVPEDKPEEPIDIDEALMKPDIEQEGPDEGDSMSIY